MAHSQKYIFLQALIITFVVFNIGIFFGYKLESSRIDKINNWYLESEIGLLDQKILGDMFGFIEFDCNAMIEENMEFADKIFEEARVIEKYEQASRINSDIIAQHKRYDLLRILFWVNSMKIKAKCNSNYHDVVYLYKYDGPSIEQKAKQKFFSNLLFQIKQDKGNQIMLIPIAGDINASSINLLMQKYGITEKELPVILIDEKIKITDVESVMDVEKYLN